ncbi:MAG: class I SAM-dependent methyltransferase [Candidatus Aenigmarchaeota archaeon]|nr:class I SAM-dependent methyltransferase [Candidatus Aenigmarchaeota archaeon]
MKPPFELDPPVNDSRYPYPVYDGGRKFYEQTRMIGDWGIGKDDGIVADIGCGPIPFPYANLLIDKNVDNDERWGHGIPNDGREIIYADLEVGLPFPDKHVDFLYCSHVLEHLNDPVQGCREIIRVAKRGFIEVPTIVYEMLFGGDESLHEWVAEYFYPTEMLIFRKLSPQEREAIKKRKEDGERFIKRLQLPGGDRYCGEYFEHQDLFTVCFIWKDNFKFAVYS